MGGALTKDAGEPSNQDAFVFWYSLKNIYGDPENLSSYFQTFMVDQANNYMSEGNADMDDEDAAEFRKNFIEQRHQQQQQQQQQQTSSATTSSSTSNGSPNLTSQQSNTGAGNSNGQESYVLMGPTKDESKYPSPASTSKISFIKESNPELEEINKTLMQTINCKLQLIPPELNHFTLNLDNHYLTEKLFLSICATIIYNNANYSNRHLATTLRDTPLTTMRRKKIQTEYLNYISQYYFTLTKLSLKKTNLTQRSLEALSQALKNNKSITELDLGGNELNASGIAVLTSAIRSNQTITRLNLSDVRAYDEGAFMIAAFLMSTKVIKTIDLSTNHITERGFEVLKQSTLRNSSITSLFLEDNNIDQSKLYTLEHILKRNACVHHIFDILFEKIPWGNRKFKNKIQSFKRNVIQTRANSTLNMVSSEDEKTPLFRLMNKQQSSNNIQVPTAPEQLPSNRFTVGHSETIGKRPTMEDRMVAYGCYRNQQNCEFYSVFDGHGGKSASDYAADNIYRIFGEYLDSTNQSPFEAFKLTYQNIHNQIAPWPFIGTTAASVYINGSNVYVANVGDSRVVLGKFNQETKQMDAERLTVDHRPVDESERNRIVTAGGTVLNGRLNGMLAVSRALGDSFLTPYVIPDPHLQQFELTSNDRFLILACDGVWDLISDEEAVTIVAGISDPSKSSEKLRDFAYQQGSTDNISVMVVKLSEY